ncbi:hypothetical protein PGT21_013695 [Puccinia graminis f. sp. tritici]|uniref:Uncharacterized protein n=1 Tax=Puccinia graminis f. sp. tritici TaxID=56615 RepID=A0A5B0LNC2_PUCGR|nr:hypothetical protein PGT21_013695 [Puccinia graminis f. sp. tritici]KAA1104962.1 hypothetical protein PGTUg99_010249 [Puccinia graminis f. sp. tritici]
MSPTDFPNLKLPAFAYDLPPPSIADDKIDAGGPSLCSVLFVIYFNRSRLLLLSAFFLNIYTNYDLPIRFPTRAATKEYRQNDMLLPSSLRRSNNADYDPTTRFNTSDLAILLNNNFSSNSKPKLLLSTS